MTLHHPSVTSRDWQLFVESVQDYAMLMLDVAGRVLTWNEGARRMSEYAAEEIVGRSFSTFFLPADLATGKPARELAEAERSGRVEDVGWRVRKDGSVFWANVVMTALRDDGGQLRGFGIVTRDLTAQMQSEMALRRSEERFRLLVESVEDYAIFMLDPDGRVATWNRGAEAIKGYSAHEIIGQSFTRFYSAEDVAAGRPALKLERARTVGRVEDEGWRVRKDGTAFWASVVITALRDANGDLVGFTKVTRDLSTRREAEEALRRSEERFRLLVDSVVDYAMYMLDPTGHVTTWNHGAEKLKGYTSDEVIGRHFGMFFPREAQLSGRPQRELEVALAEGRFEEESYRCRKDGSLFLANVVLTPMRDAHGSLLGFAKVTRDLTARANAERIARELVREQAARAAAEEAEARIRAAAALAEKAAQQAEEASRLKDEFLATVSHELRTPLNAIVGWSSLLRNRAVDGELRRGLEVVHRNALSQGRIIEDILDVSRIITGKLRLDLSATDLRAVVREALDVVRPAAMAREISLELTAPEEPCRLYADAERLQQVAWNLLSNAVKFGKKGGSIRVRIERVDSSYALTVTDDGQGIPIEFLPFVFDRFKQADSSATRRIGGLGLGLALVRHLVELHGGRATVTSEGPGRGATFTVVLPVRPLLAQRDAGDTDAHATAQDMSAQEGTLHGVRVLVVDDEEDARDLVAMVLSSAGAQVCTAGSAGEGLAAYHTFRPHVLVSDVGMPEEDGYSFMRRIRALEPSRGQRIPALALTAYARHQDRAAALTAGFTAHLGKPVEPDMLLQAVLALSQTNISTP